MMITENNEHSKHRLELGHHVEILVRGSALEDRRIYYFPEGKDGKKVDITEHVLDYEIYSRAKSRKQITPGTGEYLEFVTEKPLNQILETVTE